MAMSPQREIGTWGFLFLAVILILWSLNEILFPFLLGMALAYLLDPIADRLERVGCSRFLATLIITVLALSVIVGLLLLLVPRLASEIPGLLASLPLLLASLLEIVRSVAPELVEDGNLLGTSVEGLGGAVQTHGSTIVSGVMTALQSVLDSVIFLLITPVIMVYMLNDWDRMISTVNGYLPHDHAPVIRDLFREMDRVLASFVRRQLSVCALLAIFYATLLVSVGLDFGLVVGLIAGLISFIPLFGAILGMVLSVGLALFQFWSDPLFIGLVAAIFLTGQALEQYVLTPRIVGRAAGLHPVTILFALSAFGALLGFVGVLVAVPAAAVIGVLVRHGLCRYRASRLFLGQGPRAK